MARYTGLDRKEHSQSFPRKNDAERFLHDQETRKARREWISPELASTTFEDFWPRFLEASAHLRPATVDLYTRLATRHLLPHFGPQALADVSPLDVRAWVAERQEAGTGAATINAAFRLLRRVFNAAADAGILLRNPCTGTKAPTPGTEEMRFLDAAQVRAVADAHPEPYRALVYLLGYGGLRIGEAAALRAGDLDLLRGKVRVERAVSEVGGRLHVGPTKTGARRAVTLPPFLRQMLSEHLDTFPPGSGGYVFTAPEGGPLRPQNYRRRPFRDAVRATGLGPLRVHDLRHSCASILLAAGATIKEIADRLGHSSPAVTLRTYAHVLPALEERTVERLEAAWAASEPGPIRDHGGTTVVPLTPRETQTPL